MSVLVVGSVAFDSIETPTERHERILGGAANYFSLSASHFSPVRLVAVVGDDFPQDHVQELESRGVDMAGLQRVAGGKTFHWAGRYNADGSERETLVTELNVFADFKPVLTPQYKDSKFVFLANIHPGLQLDVLDQVKAPDFVAADTMNLWIDSTAADLRKVLARVDAIFINEGEAQMLAGEHNLIKAGRAVAAMGPKTVILKVGAFGAMVFVGEEILFVPALPLHNVVDPTGAGDTFAGGFVGWLARQSRLDLKTLHRAAAVGSVMGAFACEGFGVTRLAQVRDDEIEARFKQLKNYGDFDGSALFA